MIGKMVKEHMCQTTAIVWRRLRIGICRGAQIRFRAKWPSWAVSDMIFLNSPPV